ncbi:nickel-dependent hydrogenase large subunit [Undibacterium sp. CY18W]|uniref:Nickel-dependent hydrogenase large subunit n=1 Tax=Undibacterium hunanense TaxID=2762292 RepID=A0ABR6ZMR3_9BURK|nr:nickel-dependent hydrogenase large subunit [Undibacterium hunanense]MBC3917191.1 nickel-dependent hydrogenase large subunit [Undibacterium hunanense]
MDLDSEQQTQRTDTVSVTAENGIDADLMRLIRQKNKASMTAKVDPLSRLEGALAVHCRVDLESRTVLNSASMATLFKGYESLLPGRALKQVGMVSATASGICGGVHATASALCLEMALGLKPPPLGIVLRNLLLSCQYLNDNCMHLFVLAGPDYSQQVIEQSNPEIWVKACQSHCRHQQLHGYQHVSDILHDLNKGGALYREALHMVALARQAYTVLGGKYPHSESIIPGGVSIHVDAGKMADFSRILQPFASYSRKTAAVWDEVFDFMLDANPLYEDIGRSVASMLDFGQWDHPDHYDGSYAHCDAWGEKRWSTPAVMIRGELLCTRLSLLNAGMEEFLDYSFQQRSQDEQDLIKADPLGNPVSAYHPWNKRTQNPKSLNPQAYSWGSSLSWRGHNFEVGAYARLYLTAAARKIPDNPFVAATGRSLEFCLPVSGGTGLAMQWRIPPVWNAFERNRARAYSLAFNFSVTQENIAIAGQLIRKGETLTHVALDNNKPGVQLGVGLWGASRGFLAHWAVIREHVIDNYQIAIPSRINVGTCTPGHEPGPLEMALQNTPIIESSFSNASDFSGIDIQRTIQSFDPCMSCTAHVLIDKTEEVLVREIDTHFPAVSV